MPRRSRKWQYSATVQPKNTSSLRLHKIIKCWDEENPDAWQDIDEVKVDVIRDGELFETVSLNRENEWIYKWEEELDPEHSHDWSFVEQPIYEKNMVICAYNYGRHFGRLRDIPIGSEVDFTDADGNVFRYIVDDVVSLQSRDSKRVKSGEYRLTLFTCTVGGATRITVRCIEMDETM